VNAGAWTELGPRPSPFENATDDGRSLGDGAYLFDPQGDIRAWMTYPCVGTCPQPLSDRSLFD
jgi:hypothetical protein